MGTVPWPALAELMMCAGVAVARQYCWSAMVPTVGPLYNIERRKEGGKGTGNAIQRQDWTVTEGALPPSTPEPASAAAAAAVRAVELTESDTTLRRVAWMLDAELAQDTDMAGIFARMRMVA